MSVGFAREFLQITKESAFGTIMTLPTRGTDQIAIRLEDGNSWTPRGTPVTVPYMYGGGLNEESGTISDKSEVKGTLKVKQMCYSHCPILLGAALTRVNSLQTSPWTTTEPANQLASFCVDHAIWQDDTGAYKRTRYRGCKIDTGNLTVSEDSQTMAGSFDIIGSVYDGNTYDSSSDPDAAAFPQPDDNEYATDFVLFIHALGLFKDNGSAFAKFLSLTVSWQYNHVVNFFANRWVQQMRTWGRKVNLVADALLLASPTWRADFQTLASKTITAGFSNGVNTLTFDMKANARIESLDDDLPLATNYQRKVSFGSRFDTAAHTEFAFTYA